MQATNSADPDQMQHSVASDLDLHYLPMSYKKDARHKWVKMQLICLSHKSCRNLGGIIRLFALCKGGNFNIHIWAWFGNFIF